MVWFLIVAMYVIPHPYYSEEACAHAMHVMEDQILVQTDGTLINKKPQTYRCVQTGEAGYGA